MSKRLPYKYLIILLILPIVAVISIVTYVLQEPADDHIAKQSTFSYINDILIDSVPFSRQLRQTGVSIKYHTGETLQNDIFTSPNGLVKNFQLVDSDYTLRNDNTKALLNFNDSISSDKTYVYATIIPSASGVLKDTLPAFSTTLNQKNLIENTYNQFAGEVTSIDTFTTLFENNDKYIYFRTEDTITPLGAYFTYNEIISKMLVTGDVLPANNFGVYYSKGEYYGSLYDNVPYQYVEGDIFSFYEYYQPVSREIVFSNSVEAFYNRSLYNTNYNDLQAYNYGADYLISIDDLSRDPLSLLLIGDDSASFILPFIANHYSNITYINTASHESIYDRIKPEIYDQVLVFVSADSYMNSDALATTLKNLQS